MKTTFLLLLILTTLAIQPLWGEEHVIILDPGHGGRGCSASVLDGDHWNPRSKQFEYGFRAGASYEKENLHEHEIVFSIVKKVQAILESASSAEGFHAFEKTLKVYGTPCGEAFERPAFRILLSRKDNYQAVEKKHERYLNRFFRLYDSPMGFFPTGQPYHTIHPGRMSMTSRHQAEMVVSVHVNASENKETRGMAAVITPNMRVFRFVDQIMTQHGKERGRQLLRFLAWYGGEAPVFSSLEELIRDVDTYFNRRSSVTRHSKVTWRYKGTRKKWEKRESSKQELQRRGLGNDLGGDNLRATEDILKFTRLALLRELEKTPANSQQSMSDLVGPIQRAYARDYAMPMLINAVNPYLELGYLTNEQDRLLLAKHHNQYAEGIAVGIYAMFYGLNPHNPLVSWQDPILPEGTKILWDTYISQGRNYFKYARRRLSDYSTRALQFRDVIVPLPVAKIQGEALHGTFPPAKLEMDGTK